MDHDSDDALYQEDFQEFDNQDDAENFELDQLAQDHEGEEDLDSDFDDTMDCEPMDHMDGEDLF